MRRNKQYYSYPCMDSHIVAPRNPGSRDRGKHCLGWTLKIDRPLLGENRV